MGVVKKIGQKIGLVGEGSGGANLSNYDYASAIKQAQAAQEEQNKKQNDLADIMLAQVRGEGPSMAQLQMQQGLQTAQQQAAGSMASQKGLNPALAARLVGQNQAKSAGDVAGQSALLRAQEMVIAQNQYANLLAQQRAANQNMYTSSANAMNGQNAGQIQNAQGMANTSIAQAGQFGKLLSGMGQAAAGGGQGAWEGGEIENHKDGGRVHGEEVVEGDSPLNDTVLAKLSPGEIVIPKSAASDVDKAKEFLDHVMKQSSKDHPDSGYARVLSKHKELENRLKVLEHCFGGKI